jgi:hypothetical protein
MIKRKLGKTGFDVSPVVYGGIVSMSDGQDASDRYVSWAIDHGINYFDVAPTYGDAQEKLGNSLKPYRNDVHLACKTMERRADGVKRELEESLKLLHTDYLDVYQMHALESVDEVETAFGKGGAMEVMLRAKEEGIVRSLGITCHNEDAALLALSLYDFDTVLFPTNWGLHLGKNFGERLSKFSIEKDFGFLGMKSLIHRTWKNENEQKDSGYPKSWCKPIIRDEEFAIVAMKYALSLGVDTLVPPGNFEHFSFAVDHIDECLSNPLTTDDVDFLKCKLKQIDGMYFF